MVVASSLVSIGAVALGVAGEADDVADGAADTVGAGDSVVVQPDNAKRATPAARTDERIRIAAV
ncbi:hypothetical protein GCM10009820_35010 [Leifsonia soli]